MNKKEQAIRYIDGRMDKDEKLHFEEMLASDRELQEETERVKNLLLATKADSNPEADETYFINMLPEFHSRRTNKKRYRFAKLAYSLSTVAAVVLLVFILFKPGSTVNYTNLSDLSKSLSESEINDALSQYSEDYSITDLAGSASARTDSIVSNMVADELDLTPSVDNAVADKYLSTDELISSLDESEANELYSQLINEDIIKGEKQ